MWGFFVSTILLSSLWDFSEAQTNYCKICSDHTMCKYPDDRPSPDCGRVVRHNSSEYIKVILDNHNLVRKRVAAGNETSGRPGPLPPAADMLALTWDPELANIAMRWGLQCKLSPDKCRDVDRFTVGQNMYYYKCTDCIDDPPDWVSAIRAWYETVKNLPKYSISPYQYSSDYGPYTQLVWSRTMTVGCAHLCYTHPGSSQVTKAYICNYGPTGNVVGPLTQVYGIGRPCTVCPWFCQDNTLCSFPTQQN